MNSIWINVHSSGHPVTDGRRVFGAGAEDQAPGDRAPCAQPIVHSNLKPVAGRLSPQSDALGGGIVSNCQPRACEVQLCKSRGGTEPGCFHTECWFKHFTVSKSQFL